MSGILDIKSRVKVGFLHPTVATTATQTIQGLDITGWKSAMLVVEVGAHSADDLVVTYQEKDTGGSWANIAESDLDGVGTVQSRAIVAGDADTVIYIGYKGIKNNVGVVITDSGTGSVVIGAIAVAGNPDEIPQNLT
jgi:hypothetical protein|tara:strand:- start:28850 stop:29260 length:411 start_codon:yes stop_codon:yes gene_type:complete